MAIYLHKWAQGSLETLKQDFALNDEQLEGVNILLASYNSSSESGYAFVLYERDGLLYEVHASHDSIKDLQGQWDPEETSVEALLFRLTRGNLGSEEAGINHFREELYEVLQRLTLH